MPATSGWFPWLFFDLKCPYEDQVRVRGIVVPANGGRAGYGSRRTAGNDGLRRWDDQCRRFVIGTSARARSRLRPPGRRLPDARAAGNDHRRSGQSFSLLDPRRRTGHPVWRSVRAEGFIWSGRATVAGEEQEWPDWYPPAEMLARKPELRQHMVQLQSGIGMKGGPDNPLGARAMYLWSGNKDTLYRIHGTNEPWTIGTNVSSGCIRLTNEDIVDLYNRTPIGAKVVVFGIGKPAAAAQ